MNYSEGGGAPETKLHGIIFFKFVFSLLISKVCYLVNKIIQNKTFTLKHRNKKYAFTMAEVLITIGIIGIIAAMTLPGVIKGANKNITANKVKKIYSVLQNGVNLAISEKGEIKDWYDETAYQEGFSGAYNLYSYYIKPYFNITQECISGTNNGNGYKKCGYKEHTFYSFDGRAASDISSGKIPVILNDGSILIFRSNKEDLSADGSGNWGYYWAVYYDVNGGKEPNKYGIDVFVFHLNPYTNKVAPAGLYRSISNTQFMTKESINQRCLTDGDTCTAKILLDNWKITY